MMTALATVTDVQANEQGYSVGLSCQQQTSCKGCASQKSCGTGIVSKAVGNKSLFWQLTTSTPVEAGQVVEIGFPEKQIIQSAAIVYLIPLFMLMLGAMIGHLWLAPFFAIGEGGVILTSVLFAGGGVWLAKKLSQTIEQKSAQQVVLIRILSNERLC
ncbi:transcriptional regulator [Vibrio sp. 10N.286.49.B3]|uniref:SoxR reducing system RseC family protein n=1 Tax=Vibrio sp. 10N.286.49.B3 TaxID=1880855 RepID=UPI000C85F09A|nr:SoxR reducing system RseC family protein [Vibrio sp. 10N.286.49.B3]PMH43852.1 transcriptional regulator [Vibrio sp. 10N.286.49.B3]